MGNLIYDPDCLNCRSPPRQGFCY